MIEGILIVLDGSKGALPAFFKKDNKIFGAFIMNRIWVFPVIAFILVSKTALGYANGVDSTGYWPLFKPGLSLKELMGYTNTFIPLLLLSGYKTVAISSSTLQMIKKSSIRTIVFGGVLLILSLVSIRYEGVKLLAAVFAMAGRDFISYLEGRHELRGEPFLAEREYGVVVVDTIPGGPAEEMGICSGEIVREINNVEVKHTEDIREILKQLPSFIWVKLSDSRGRERTLEHRNYREGIKSLGIITIPQSLKGVPVLGMGESALKRFMDKLD